MVALNPNDEVTIKMTVNDLNQFITAVNAYYTGLISRVIAQANSQGSAEPVSGPAPAIFTNGPQPTDGRP
jgi:hypothetical protein